jgi:hypothetical protein
VLYYRCIEERNERNPQEEKLMTSREENKSEGQPCAKEAQSDCRMRAAESFCGIEQMTPRDNTGGNMVAPGMASANEKSHDNDDERVNSCPA